MTTTTAPVPVRDLPEHILLRSASWAFYEAFLREVDDQHLSVTYDNGRMEIMSPLPRHERWKRLIGRLIEGLSLERGIAIASLGSTTFRREDLAKGLEPDECYYVQNESRVRSRDELDLRRDPPPDLAIEINITHRDIAREPIYAALGVPELWRFDGHRLAGLQLQSDGHYRVAEMSLAFPFLRLADVERFLRLFPQTDETSIVRAFQQWVREQMPRQ